MWQFARIIVNVRRPCGITGESDMAIAEKRMGAAVFWLATALRILAWGLVGDGFDRGRHGERGAEITFGLMIALR